jgi:hypothetical protein
VWFRWRPFLGVQGGAMYSDDEWTMLLRSRLQNEMLTGDADSVL